jgi:peptide/nickel transport system substrate-binding protein
LLKDFTPGSNPTVFAKNPNYWRPGLPKSDVVNLVSVVNDESRLAALQRGEMNIIEDPLFTSLKSLPSQGLKVVAANKGTMELICLHVKTPPFDDVRVLNAFKYALNRPQMLELLLLGNGITIDDIPTYPAEQYGPTQAPRAQNVAMAKKLLAEAGYPNGLTVQCHTSNAEARLVDFCTAYKGMAGEAGIDVDVIIDPPNNYYSAVWNHVSMFADSWIARPVPGMLALLFLPGSSNNETQWDNEQWTDTFVKATASVNPAERQTLFRQLQTQIINEGGNLVPYMGFATTATSGDVVGWRPSGDILEGGNLVTSSLS